MQRDEQRVIEVELFRGGKIEPAFQPVFEQRRCERRVTGHAVVRCRTGQLAWALGSIEGADAKCRHVIEEEADKVVRRVEQDDVRLGCFQLLAQAIEEHGDPGCLALLLGNGWKVRRVRCSKSQDQLCHSARPQRTQNRKLTTYCDSRITSLSRRPRWSSNSDRANSPLRRSIASTILSCAVRRLLRDVKGCCARAFCATASSELISMTSN